MGEYAKDPSTGERVKIGTCEDMYYLRADQAWRVQPEYGNVDPIRDAAGIRFRFPWPEEDDIGIGQFDDPWRSLRVSEVEPFADHDHYSVQFKADAGYLVSLPCPESAEGKAFAESLPHGIHRNGFRGALHLVQQRLWEGLLVPVCRCACDAKYRLPTLDAAMPVVLAIRAHAVSERITAERNDTPGNADVADRLDMVADRILKGFDADYVKALGFAS